MQVVIDIPENEIPTKQDIISVAIHFMDGKIIECNYPFMELKQEPKTGQWIFVDKTHEHAYCSECGYGNVDLLDGRPYSYCSNCGAMMVGVI